MIAQLPDFFHRTAVLFFDPTTPADAMSPFRLKAILAVAILYVFVLALAALIGGTMWEDEEARRG